MRLPALVFTNCFPIVKIEKNAYKFIGKSKRSPDKIHWLHSYKASLETSLLLTAYHCALQGIHLEHNTSARVIRSNQSLVLQKITKHYAGNYACSAINDEGETVSNQLPLRVKCEYTNK